MNSQKILALFFISFFFLSWNWKNFSIRKSKELNLKVKTVWALDTVKNKALRTQIVNNSPPLITKDLVIQGNAVNGVKAYKKANGQKVWNFEIASGVAGALREYKGNIYFGGRDGFFYSLQRDTGDLNWKFWTGSENLGSPLVHQERVYWTTSNQKVYALNLKGQLLWIYSGPSPSGDFIVRGRPSPVVYKNLIYMGFYDGTVVSLNKQTGQLKWKKRLATSKAIIEDLGLSKRCLFIPVFDFYLFCLHPLTGKVLWKQKGGSASLLNTKGKIYQFHQGKLLALNKSTGKVIWKQSINHSHIFPPLLFKKFLLYGSSSMGKIIFVDKRNGSQLKEQTFGRGLAGAISADEKEESIYFFSVDGWLYKLLLL